MKTQISRNAHDTAKYYTGVYQQQGRMITDADWNALTDIGQHQLVSALAHAIASGAPSDTGLGISNDGRIEPGTLYVDGHRAELPGTDLVALHAQPNYPQPPNLPTNNLVIYADLWERTVTALEDGELLDAGLHGADTSSRSQQMLQVKWCANTDDPAIQAQNPTRGTAPLALRLRKILVGSDPCDPCASEVDLDERVGNYLFRVEVHDLFEDGGNRFLLLKWSRDNGAECYPADNIAVGFDQGDWVWEFFDSDSEKMLGHHFPIPATYRPRRGVLDTDFTVPGAGLPADYVRQWDGYALINLTSQSLVEGFDRGTELGDSLGTDAHGFVGFDSGLLTINGELLEMELRYRDASDVEEWFLAGDFWQAEVRESVRNPGDYVLGSETAGEAPAGILHHYLVLGELDAVGNAMARTDAQQRQFNFPALTNITAKDVGFTDTCPGLYNGAENVQAALTALCAIGAEDIAWIDPGCPDSVRELLAASLGAWPDLDADGKTSVKDALDALFCHLNLGTLPYTVPDCGDDARPTVRSLLPLTPGVQPAAAAMDALLCNLNATHIPLDKSSSICPALDGPSVQTVQQALQTLCQRSGGACAIPVEPGRQLEELLKAFANTEEATEIWLCLRPGEHVIEGELKFANKRSIKLAGAGRSVSQVRFSGAQLALAAAELHLEDVGFFVANAGASLALQADTVSACHCEFERATGAEPAAAPLLSWLPVSANRDDVSIHWVDNRMSTYWRRVLVDPVVVAPTDIVGAQLNARVADLFASEALLADERAMNAAIKSVAADIVDLPPATKKRWSRVLKDKLADFTRSNDGRPVVVNPVDGDGLVLGPPGGGPLVNPGPGGGTVIMRRRDRRTARPTIRETPLATTADELVAIGRKAIAGTSVTEVAERLEDLVANAVDYEYNAALSLASARHRGSIVDNQIYGDVILLGGRSKGVQLSSAKLVDLANELEFLVIPEGQLRFAGNWVHRVASMIESGSIKDGVLVKPLTGYERLSVCDNTFFGEDNAFVGAHTTFQGNDFPKFREQHEMGIALCDMGVFTTNMGVRDDISRFTVGVPNKNSAIIEQNLMFIMLITA